MTYRRFFTCLLAATWVASLVVAVGWWAPLQAAAGLLLFFLLPGTLATYAILSPEPALDWRLRAVLSVALSVSIGLLLGLTLALAFAEVSRAAVAVGLALVATASAGVARSRVDRDATIAKLAKPRVSPVVVLVSVALLLPCIALSVATLDVDSLPGKFTALTLTRQGSTARLTTENYLGQPMRYRYELRGGGRLLRSGRIEVAAGGTRSLLLPLPPGLRRLQGLLYIGGQRPYRSVSLQLAHRPGTTPTLTP